MLERPLALMPQWERRWARLWVWVWGQVLLWAESELRLVPLSEWVLAKTPVWRLVRPWARLLSADLRPRDATRRCPRRTSR